MRHTMVKMTSLAATLVAFALAAATAAAADTPHRPTPSDPKPADYPEWNTVNPGEYLAYNQRATLVQRGKIVYAKYCLGCHGVNGDGKGVAATRLMTKPRDFTKGIYKFRSTDSSSLPLETDIYRTITRGLPRVSMPGFPLMPEREKLAVIAYVKTFYPKWDEQKDRRVVVPVPRAPADILNPDRAKRGRVVYTVMQCGKCHGIDGAGTGATQTEYVDAWGNQQKPLNFTRGRLKGGDDPEDIYRTFHTGLRSIMPAYDGETLATVNLESFESLKGELPPGEAEALAPQLASFPKTGAEIYAGMDEAARAKLVQRNSWDLVAYILSLRKPVTTAAAVLGDKR